MPQINTGAAYHLGATPVQKLYAGATQIWPQAPILSSILPTSMLHLSGATTITATGSNFKSGCVLQIKGTGGWVNMNASTVVSPTTMSGSVDMIPGNYLVSVVDAQGRRTAEKSFQGQHNTPTLSSISPTSMFLEDAAQRLTVTGSNFYGAGSGYTGLHLFLLPPGGGWQDKGQMVVSSGTSAYLDGIDPSPIGTWKVMVGYDGPNTTRSAQQNLTVTNKPIPTPTVTAANGTIDPFMGGNIYLTGTNFVAPMTTNLGMMTSFCDLNEDYALGSSSGGTVVDSPTTAHIACLPQDGHYSVAMPDCSHKVRVTTPAGTSPWLDNQPICV